MFSGVPRTNKPPTMSWLIAVSMWLGGESEVAARLPAALSGVLTAWLIALLAGRWYGNRIAVLAGMFQATTVYSIMQARLAEADMPLCAAVTAAMVTFALSVLPTNRFSEELPAMSRWSFCLRAMLFHTCVGIAFLFKGPVGPLFVFLACVPYAVIAWRRWQQREPLRFLFHPSGLLVLLIFLTVWPVSAYLAYPPILESWRNQILGRVAGDLGGREPFLFYFYTLPWLTLPAFLFVPAMLVRFRPGTLLRPFTLFLFLWTVGGLVLLQISIFKHKHYLIPLLPPVSVAAALGLTRILAWRHGRLRHRPSNMVGWLALILALGVCAVLVVHARVPKDMRTACDALIASFCLPLCGAVVCEARRKIRAQLACYFAAFWFVEVIVVVSLVPRFDSYSIYAEFAERTSRRLASIETTNSAAPPIYLQGLGESQIAFYLPLTARRADRQSDLLPLLPIHGGEAPIYVITTHRSLAGLPLEQNGIKTEQLDTAGLRPREQEGDRLLLVKLWRP
jgi:4-amino-4-deoxy-L-arabinose transferase-like glycosyltransferase